MSTRTISGRGQLTTGGKPIGHETLEEDGAEVGSGQVDGSGVACRPRADDDLGRAGIDRREGPNGDKLTTLECPVVLLSFLPVTGAM